MTKLIQPALTDAEWHHHRSGCVHIDVVDDEIHVVVTDPDDDVVSVSGASQLFALIALANDALPNDDPRKVCRTDLSILSVLIDRLDREHEGDARLLPLAAALHDKLAALLPPR